MCFSRLGTGDRGGILVLSEINITQGENIRRNSISEENNISENNIYLLQNLGRGTIVMQFNTISISSKMLMWHLPLLRSLKD